MEYGHTFCGSGWAFVSSSPKNGCRSLASTSYRVEGSTSTIYLVVPSRKGVGTLRLEALSLANLLEFHVALACFADDVMTYVRIMNCAVVLSCVSRKAFDVETFVAAAEKCRLAAYLIRSGLQVTNAKVSACAHGKKISEIEEDGYIHGACVDRQTSA